MVNDQKSVLLRLRRFACLISCISRLLGRCSAAAHTALAGQCRHSPHATALCACRTDGLVPMADMLNHRRPRETSWQYSSERGAFIITALKGLQQGDQIYDSYGRKCNSRFFVNY